MNKIGRYEIRGTLGKGGMGVVFLAWDPELVREVAIKFILPEGDADPEFKKRFDREARAYGLLKHEGIVTVYDRGEFQSRPYIVMEYLEGDTLDALFKKRTVTPRQSLAILRQVADALDFAHRKSIVHRDVKPANVMVAADGSAKLMDFGIVKGSISGVTQTATGMAIGSPHYMPPEQLLGQEITGAADQWALAIVAYECLAGNRPFRAETWDALGYQICNVQAPGSAALTPAMLSVLRKALSREPGSRFPNCLSFVEELEKGLVPSIALRPWRFRWYIPASILLFVAAAAWVFRPSPVVAPAPLPARIEQPVTAPPTRIEKPATSPLAKIEQPAVTTPAKTEHPAPKKLSVLQDDPPRKVGDEKTNEIDGLRYVWIPPGRFRMGCSDGDNECLANEKPAHEVTLTKGFWLGESEVTQRAYQRVVLKNPSRFKGEDLPVENVTWGDAEGYCGKIGGRLPTEAEWEYAARSGTTGASYGNLDAVAWHTGNGARTTHPVKLKAANRFGLYDMLGNAWEWTADWNQDTYEGAAGTDPKGPVSGDKKPVRGGSSVGLVLTRVSIRIMNEPTFHSRAPMGFRCAWE